MRRQVQATRISESNPGDPAVATKQWNAFAPTDDRTGSNAHVFHALQGCLLCWGCAGRSSIGSRPRHDGRADLQTVEGLIAVASTRYPKDRFVLESSLIWDKLTQ